jgi:glutaminyl-peptide cyclotransferase
LSQATKRLPAGVAVLASFLMFSCGSDKAHTSSPANPAAARSATSVSGPQVSPVTAGAANAAPPASQTGGFDGARAYGYVAKLVSFGPHPPASAAIQNVQKYIRSQLEGFGCSVDEDDFHAQTPIGTLAMKNIVAKVPGAGRGIILLLTHYDTKRVANFVGAEDGGSSTGLMLEMARLVCKDKKQPNAVWIAFLDGEEAQLDQWSDADSVYGSRELAARLAVSGDLKRVRAVILADMVGQKNLDISRESNSTKWLTDLLWKTAARLGYKDVFVPRELEAIDDDHLPFLHRGVPAVDLIDLADYQAMGYWHTPEDTLDKISPRSLAIVGHVILESVKELQMKFR